MFRVLHPDPPPLCYVTMVTGIPVKLRCDGEPDPEYAPRYRLNGGLQIQGWEAVNQLLDVPTHFRMANQGALRVEREGG